MALLPARAAAQPAEKPPVRVLTFNIRYGTADDGPDHWDRRKDLVVRVVERAAPDILGVQEALDFQVDFLKEKLPRYQVLGQGREGGRRGEHAALLVDRERFEVVQHGDFWLSETPETPGSRGWDAALPRMATWAVLEDRKHERRLVVLNTHLDHSGARSRERSAELIVERLRPHAELPMLVFGDFNAGEASAPLRTFQAAGLRDTYRDIVLAGAESPKTEPPGTFHRFKGGTPSQKIDFVLASRSWKTEAAAIVRDSFDGRYPSDHYPVSATVTYR